MTVRELQEILCCCKDELSIVVEDKAGYTYDLADVKDESLDDGREAVVLVPGYGKPQGGDE